ncbi:hypothetical protein BBROOKSOX_1563 [Bathymodiolus brooksi thiotrophic gill symbiont]|nr:hypothetical protein BBROOKSOX_1563 [Bathymodiolus brooksi thiotrophic gill symbiont]
MLYIVYLYNTSGAFNMFAYYLLEDKTNDITERVFYKGISKLKDIKGEYKFTCKYENFPYVLGIGFKYKYKFWDIENNKLVI